MILKELRISQHLSQQQLAQMSGLNVRTIQRIESDQKASVESLKCLAAALEVDVATLNQKRFVLDKNSRNWKTLRLLLKCWFVFNFLDTRPSRRSATRIIAIGHVTGFGFCSLGLINEAALVRGL